MKTTKSLLVYVVSFGLFVIPFIGFIVANGMYFPFIVGKGFTFRILVEILFGLYVILAAIAPEYRPKLSWLTKSVLLFGIITFLADIGGVNPYKSLWSNYERMEGFVLILHLILYYIVASSVFKTREKWNQLWNVTIIASLAMSLYGALQLLGKIAINQGGVRVDGPFGNASYFAIYLVFHIFLCLHMLFNSTQLKWQKWVYGLIALFESYILYFTATRGAILGLVFGLALAGFLVIWKEKQNKHLRKIGAGVFVGIIALGVVFFAVRNTSFVQKSPVLSRFASLGLSEFQTQGRYYIWPMALKGIAERPILGWGQEDFNFVFNKYYNPQLFGQEEWFDRSHDLFLDWLVAGGILGFLSYASMYVVLLYLMWRKKSTLSLSEKSLFTGMIFAYVFHNTFVFDNLISYILFFSILAYMHSMSTESGEHVNSKMFSGTTIKYIVIPVVVILTIAAVYFINVPAILANETLIAALSPQGNPETNLALFKKVYTYNSFGSDEATEQLVSTASSLVATQQLSPQIKQEFYDFAAQKIEEKVIQSPHDARYLVFAGSFFNRFGNYDAAIPFLQHAIEESPNKQSIYFELGVSYLGKGDKQGAFRVFKRAYDLKPDAPESKIIYAVGAIYTNNIAVENQILPQIDKNIITSDNRFLKAYADIGDTAHVLSILNARLAQNPNDIQTKLNLAAEYNTIGQKQKAISLIQEIIAAHPEFKTQGETYIKQIQG